VYGHDAVKAMGVNPHHSDDDYRVADQSSPSVTPPAASG
jgi:hypothetical protein